MLAHLGVGRQLFLKLPHTNHLKLLHMEIFKVGCQVDSDPQIDIYFSTQELVEKFMYAHEQMIKPEFRENVKFSPEIIHVIESSEEIILSMQR